MRRAVLVTLAVAGSFALGCQRPAAAAASPHAPEAERAPEPASPPDRPTTPGPLYLVVYGPGASFHAGKPLSQQPLHEHFEYMLSLYRRGILESGGGFGDQRGGAAVFTAPDDAAALAIVRADPAVKNAVFEFELRRWHLVDWGRHAAPK